MIRSGSLLALTCLAACAAGAGPRAAAPAEATPAAASAPARLFHNATDQDFWVVHAPDRRLVIASGVRLELAPGGEITAAAWDVDLARRHESLAGALAVPARLGGGFVHWTRNAIFRSATFTGPLEAIAIDADITSIRGARPGLSAVLVLTDAGPRELPAGATKLRAVAEPGLRDLAAVSEKRAARLDAFGRLGLTEDGGRTWVDPAPATGLAVRGFALTDTEILVDTWDARFAVRGAKVDLSEAAGRTSQDSARQLQIEWPGLRAERAELPWSSGPTGPLAAAAMTGAAAGDAAFGVVQSTAVRVDLRTGKLLTVASEWIPSGLICQPVRAPDALLFACVWERYQAYGGYVLRSVAGGPPEIERAFSDEGSFVSDDDGALGFVGSCRLEQRYFDPEEQSRAMESGSEAPLAPVICVRRGPGDWVERRVDLPDGANLVAWVAAKDGRAAAIATTGDPLPAPASPAGRVITRGGVRVALLDRDLAGWYVPRPSGLADRYGVPSVIDRRFRLRDDGTIDGWLAPTQDGGPPVAVGATIDPRGEVAVHAAAPGMITTAFGGPFGVAVSREGDLYETTDHGRSYRRAGPSPVPPSALGQAACSAVGCALGPVVKVGWGDGDVTPRVLEGPRPIERASRARRLSCAPAGAPVPLVAPPPPSGTLVRSTAGWGDTLEIARDGNVPDPPPAARTASASPPATKKPPRPSPAVLRTHSLFVRKPFAPRAAPRRVEATDASISVSRIASVTPLLGPKGDVQILVTGDRSDLLLAGDRLARLGLSEGRRNARPESAGLALPGGRALVLGELRRRLTLEERGGKAPAAPVALGLDLDDARRRPLTLGRRDDGAIGVLVLDGAAPEIVGAATIDPAAAIPGPITRLAPWSSLVLADHPACKAGADPGAFRALVVVDPRHWLTLDGAALPGVALSTQGMIQVRWGRERVCLEAIDAVVNDQRVRSGGRSLHLVARWAGDGERGAALRSPDLRQDLTCRVE